MILIAGLGNPGRRYAKSRHNIGYICLNYFARKHGIRFNKKQCLSRVGMGKVASKKVILARPQTFMNRSGEAIVRFKRKYDISPENTIVIQDDMDLPPGKIRIRPRGSSAGHKGIESIISHLSSRDFVRVRVGIGRPDVYETSEDDIINFVLSDFTKDEKGIIAEAIPRVSEAIYCILTEGVTMAMNRYN